MSAKLPNPAEVLHEALKQRDALVVMANLYVFLHAHRAGVQVQDAIKYLNDLIKHLETSE